MNLQLESVIKSDVSEQLLNQIELNKLQDEQKQVLQKQLINSAKGQGQIEKKLYNANKVSLELL